MKAIRTKYIGPSNVRGSRVIATDEDGNRITVSYDDSLNSEAAHAVAAAKLCKKMNWHGHMVAGALKNGFAFVWTRGSQDYVF